MPGTHLLKLEVNETSNEARAGQFVMLRCCKEPGILLRRPFSIHRAILELRQIWLLYRVCGKGTACLAAQKRGTELDMLVPLGNGFTIDPNVHDILLVAGGAGIAPLAFLAQQALSGGHPVTLILGARTSRNLYPLDLLPPGCITLPVTEDGSVGTKGMATDLLLSNIGHSESVYACGPIPMYRVLAQHLRSARKQIPVQVSLEVRMGCGVGACFSCAINTKQGMRKVCSDGPVFAINDIIWEEIRL